MHQRKLTQQREHCPGLASWSAAHEEASSDCSEGRTSCRNWRVSDGRKSMRRTAPSVTGREGGQHGGAGGGLPSGSARTSRLESPSPLRLYIKGPNQTTGHRAEAWRPGHLHKQNRPALGQPLQYRTKLQGHTIHKHKSPRAGRRSSSSSGIIQGRAENRRHLKTVSLGVVIQDSPSWRLGGAAKPLCEEAVGWLAIRRHASLES